MLSEGNASVPRQARRVLFCTGNHCCVIYVEAEVARGGPARRLRSQVPPTCPLVMMFEETRLNFNFLSVFVAERVKYT